MAKTNLNRPLILVKSNRVASSGPSTPRGIRHHALSLCRQKCGITYGWHHTRRRGISQWWMSTNGICIGFLLIGNFLNLLSCNLWSWSNSLDTSILKIGRAPSLWFRKIGRAPSLQFVDLGKNRCYSLPPCYSRQGRVLELLGAVLGQSHQWCQSWTYEWATELSTQLGISPSDDPG